jgi:hypothetical protein
VLTKTVTKAENETEADSDSLQDEVGKPVHEESGEYATSQKGDTDASGLPVTLNSAFAVNAAYSGLAGETEV